MRAEIRQIRHEKHQSHLRGGKQGTVVFTNVPHAAEVNKMPLPNRIGMAGR